MKPPLFIGGGRITAALIAGLRRSRHRGRILVYDRHPAKLRRLAREFGITVAVDLPQAVNAAGLLIIAVRPDAVSELLATIPVPRRPITAVSVAAGIPISKLRGGLGAPVRWARAMPSPVARSGRGLTAIAFDRKLPASERKLVRDFFARVGSVLEIQENKFDVFTATYSASHGYHALASLARAAERLGLDRKTALIAAAHALGDGIVALREE